MSWLSEMRDGGQTGADVASPYYAQIPDILKQYMGQYAQRSQGAGDILSGQYGQMSQNPTDYINQIMGKYKPSDAYKFQQGEMTKAAGASAAAGGFAGTPLDQEHQQKITNALLSQDMQQWLNNVMGAQRFGLQGEAGLYGTGAQMSGELGENLARALMSQGNLAAQSEEEREKRRQDWMQGIGEDFGAVAGTL